MTKILFFFFSLLMALQVNAQDIRYVTTTGSGTMDGTSWYNASNDIQLMMDALTSGGEVWVAAGTYVPSHNISSGAYDPGSRHNSFVLRNNVKLCGGFNGMETSLAQRELHNPANETVLNGDIDNNDTPESDYTNVTDNVYHVVVSAGLTNAEIDGFTVKGGYAMSWGNHEVSGYSLDGIYGGGLFINNSNITLKNVDFKKNRAYELGGAIYGVWSTVNAVSCSFGHNTIDWGFGGAVFIYNFDAPVPGSTFTNCVFTNNVSQSPGALLGYLDGSGTAPVFNNCTFYNNGVEDYEVITYDSVGNGGDMEFNNCVIDRGSGSSSLTWSESITFRHTITSYAPFPSIAGYGNMFSINAMFADAANGDYSLQEQSPAVNSGSNSLIPSGISTDFKGNARIVGGTVDRGAFENLQAAAVTPDANGIIYVKPGSSGDNTGGSWANAVRDLAKALYAAHNNPQITAIWVAGGTYKPKYRPDNYSPANPYDRHNAFRMVPNVKVYGGFTGTESLLSERQLLPENTSILTGDLTGNDTAGFGYRGDNAYHVVIVVPGCDLSLLDGFTITGGNADYPDYDGQWYSNYFYINGEKYLRNSGGGLMSKSSMPIRNILFEENVAVQSGGACNIIGSIDITSCRFIYNVAENGGGAIYTFGGINVTNCLFSENRSDTSGGAAFINNSPAHFANCIFTGNKSVLQTGIIASVHQAQAKAAVGKMHGMNCLMRSWQRNLTLPYRRYGWPAENIHRNTIRLHLIMTLRTARMPLC